MPRGDRTGPEGMGPRTGRAAGVCAGFGTPGFMNSDRGFNRGFGRGNGRNFSYGGFGRGRGYGRGFGRGFEGYPAASMPNQPPWSEETEQEHINQEISNLKDYLKGLENRLEELGKEK